MHHYFIVTINRGKNDVRPRCLLSPCFVGCCCLLPRYWCSCWSCCWLSTDTSEGHSSSPSHTRRRSGRRPVSTNFSWCTCTLRCTRIPPNFAGDTLSEYFDFFRVHLTLPPLPPFALPACPQNTSLPLPPFARFPIDRPSCCCCCCCTFRATCVPSKHFSAATALLPLPDRSTLCSAPMVDFMEHNVLVWGGSLLHGEAFALGNALDACAFPYIGLLLCRRNEVQVSRSSSIPPNLCVVAATGCGDGDFFNIISCCPSTP